MGVSTDAILAYGYNLGGGDGDWLIEEVGEYGELKLPWFAVNLDDDGDDEDRDDDDFVTKAEKKLLVAQGFTEIDWRADGYYERKVAAEAASGVEFKGYCSDSYTSYVLAAKVIKAYRGDCPAVDFEALTREAVEGRYDEKLAAAIQALGITPKQTQPAWLLCSYWG
jgi:hypothetical protein